MLGDRKSGGAGRPARTVKKTVQDIFGNPKVPVRMRCTTRSGDLYFVAQDLAAGRFHLWHHTGGKYELVSTGQSPSGFDDMIPWSK